jgi:hypothetical protein
VAQLVEALCYKPEGRGFDSFDLWPPQRHRAVLWILAHLVVYRTQVGHDLSFEDYMDFLRRAKWKTDSWPSGRRMVGNYLSIMGFDADAEG